MKRYWCVAAVALVVGLVDSSVVAQPPGGERRPLPGREGEGFGERDDGRGFRPPPPPPLMAALDRDGDGEISADEIAKAAESLKTLDKNSDGKLSAEETRPPRPVHGGFGDTPGGRGFGPPGQGPPHDNQRPPRDGQRPPGEPQDPPNAGRENPGDRGPRTAEQKPSSRVAGIVARLMQHDRNGDGKVSQDELPEQMQRVLERADVNGDGAIDKNEAEKLAESISRRHDGKRREPPREDRNAPSEQE
mgnify:CR=1 FL=1